MSHTNITQYIDSFFEKNTLYIVMEHADGGDLYMAIQSRKKKGDQLTHNYYQEDEIMRIFIQISLGLNHIHNKNIIHRDIKTQNIFITKNGIIKIGDFGVARIFDLDKPSGSNDADDNRDRKMNLMTIIGTPYYMSPELCENKPYNFKSDVWSLGVILYELLTLTLPFQGNNIAGNILII